MEYHAHRELIPLSLNLIRYYTITWYMVGANQFFWCDTLKKKYYFIVGKDAGWICVKSCILVNSLSLVSPDLSDDQHNQW
jgi:hypothetical protein